jgi:hypothetical protein
MAGCGQQIHQLLTTLYSTLLYFTSHELDRNMYPVSPIVSRYTFDEPIMTFNFVTWLVLYCSCTSDQDIDARDANSYLLNHKAGSEEPEKQV